MRKVWGKIRENDQNLGEKWGKWNSCPPGTVRLATALMSSTYIGWKYLECFLPAVMLVLNNYVIRKFTDVKNRKPINVLDIKTKTGAACKLPNIPEFVVSVIRKFNHLAVPLNSYCKYWQVMINKCIASIIMFSDLIVQEHFRDNHRKIIEKHLSC